MEKILQDIGFGTPFIYASATFTLFYWLDQNVSEEAKRAIANTARLKNYDEFQIMAALLEVFDRLYSYPLWSRRAFFRSALLTLVFTGLFLFETRKPDTLDDLTSLGFFIPDKDFYIMLYLGPKLLVVAALVVNIASDYATLFLIEFLIRRFGTKPIFALIIGGLSASVIVLTGNVMRAFLAIGAVSLFLDGSLKNIQPFHELAEFAFSRDSFRFAIPATFVFAWLPFLALGIICLRSASVICSIVGKASWFLKDGREHPLTAIGYLAAFMVFFAIVLYRVASGVI